MDDRDYTTLLQWALPQHNLRWPGFRKVRRQVCKRLKLRIGELGLDGFAAYRRRLEGDPAEWWAFGECCHITISRFFRDKDVFEVLRERVLPDIAGERRVAHIWSAEYVSGEEPYTFGARPNIWSRPDGNLEDYEMAPVQAYRSALPGQG